ncbi:hypothetical protein [Nocardioides alkalitolerans]|uniref:hypothetical protein n=1 Tax=Nocardioides alkalitolerans TaxID=281714 RepID=UPI0012F96D26|nr:hypothetical protein [Nocardioides alkalitolerans]
MCANIGDGRVELRFDEAEGGGYISYALSDAERLDWRQIFNELGALGCQLVSYDLDEGYYTDENQICWGVVAA